MVPPHYTRGTLRFLLSLTLGGGEVTTCFPCPPPNLASSLLDQSSCLARLRRGAGQGKVC